MKKVLSTAAILSVAATSVFANPNYPVEVTKDGVLYNCAADMTVVDGVASRQCISSGASSEAGGGVFATAGLSATTIAAGVAIAIGLGFIVSQDDDSVTISTTGTN